MHTLMGEVFVLLREMMYNSIPHLTCAHHRTTYLSSLHDISPQHPAPHTYATPLCSLSMCPRARRRRWRP
jgi:hypothetical protein